MFGGYERGVWTAARVAMLFCALFGCTNSDRIGTGAHTVVHAGAGTDAAAVIDASLGTDASGDGGAAHQHDASIFSFVAANVYHDFPSLAVKRGSKFEIFIDRAIDPAQIVQLRVFGPDGFVFDFANTPAADAGNGYIYNQREPVLWYQGFVLRALQDGRYTVKVTFADGKQGQRSRVLVSNFILLDSYLQHKGEFQYNPNGGVSSANDTVLTWSTLHDVGGPDAYYNVWISSGTGETIQADTARGDNIFVSAFLDPKAGLNSGSSRQGSAQDPLAIGPQTWQTEILDSNQLDGINMVIFTPGEHFTAD